MWMSPTLRLGGNDLARRVGDQIQQRAEADVADIRRRLEA